MSYQLRVMQDHPSSLWMLDELNAPTYTVASYNDSHSSYDEPSSYDSNGYPLVNATDYSGNNNTAAYSGDFDENGFTFPLVSGGLYGTKITADNSIDLAISKGVLGTSSIQPIANKYCSDNDFSMEVWFYPQIITSNETPILADTTNNIGIYWKNGRVVFKVSSTESVGFIPTYTKKSIHAVGIYTPFSISLAIDGIIVASKSLSGFKFTNTSCSLKIGSTLDAQDSFIVDAPAIYRYSLSVNKILNHFYIGNISSSPIQIVSQDSGTLFSCPEASIRSSFIYSYPESKTWNELLDSNTYYDPINQFISFIPTQSIESKTFIIEDNFLIPTQIGLTSSKIEWRGDIGITVESSADGINYTQCVNGSSLPQFNKASFDTNGKVWIRITMSTTDSSTFLPRLSFFAIKFYTSKDIYSDNSGDTITSTSEYDVGVLNYPAFSRNNMNGVRPAAGTGFDINTSSSIKSIEMFFTPKDLYTNHLVYSLGSGGYATAEFSWNSAGVMTKTNIAALYINGTNGNAITNAFTFLKIDEPVHIVLVFTSPISNKIQLNYQVVTGSDNLYNNIAIYKQALSQATASSHFSSYIGRTAISVSNPDILLSEEPISYYNNEWTVIQTA